MTEREATKLGAELMGESAIVALGLGVLYDQHRREVEESDALEARIVALETALEGCSRLAEIRVQQCPLLRSLRLPSLGRNIACPRCIFGARGCTGLSGPIPPRKSFIAS